MYSNFNPKLYQDITLQISINLNNGTRKKISNVFKTKLGILGCTHIISPYSLSTDSIRIDKKNYITELQKQVPTYKLYASHISVFDDNSLFRLIENGTYDFNSLYLYADATGENNKNTTGKLEQLKQSDTEFIFTTQSTSSNFFFLRVLHYPGWHAYTDGKEAKILKANLLYMAIAVPKGNHIILFKYEPPYWKETVTLTLLFYSILILVLVFHKPNSSKNTE